MHITRLPIHAADDAALKKVASAWAREIQARLKAKYGERFALNWTAEQTRNHWTPGSTTQGYDQEIALGENSLPYARIVLRAPAELPRTFECRLEHIESPSILGGKIMGYFAWLAAALAFLGWAYFLFFGDGWTRIWNRITNGGPCSGCANRLEFFYFLVAGWMVVPAIATAPFFLLGEWIDRLMTRFRNKLAWRRLDKDLTPWLTGAVREIETLCGADRQVAQTFGLAPIDYLPAGTPHETLPNVIWNGTGNLLPAPGYTWAGGEDSFEVKLKEEVKPE